MTNCDRREFFVRSSLAAGAAVAIPSWIAAAFRVQDPESERVTALRAAHRRALANGKPLLVLVVPKEPQQQWERGQRLGALINHGGRDTLLELALAEPACATVEEVQKVTGAAVTGAEPLMLLVEPVDAASDAATPPPPRATAIDSELPPPPDMTGAAFEQWERLETEHAAACNANLTAALRAVLAPDAQALQRRATRVRARLSTDDLAELERFLVAGPAPRAELAVCAAAAIRASAAGAADEAARTRLLDPLAAAAKSSLVDARIPGSKWAHSQGCGTTIEGEEDDTGLRVACGMARCPKVSERFLYFFTAD